MANNELCSHFLQKQFSTQKMPEVVYTDIIPALDKHFNHDWTYEIVGDFPILNGASIVVTVQVYVPGRVTTGRCICKSTDYGQAHLRAILDAVSYIIDEKTAYAQPSQNNTQQNTGQMNADQINAALQQGGIQQGEKMVNTKEQFYNYTENGVQTDGVPMDKMTDNCSQELQQEITGMQQNTQPQASAPMSPSPNAQQSTMNPPVTGQNDPDYDKPQQKLGGYSQKQVDAINRFKKELNVVDDSMFASWVFSWDNTMTNGKKSLTPQNVDNFLSYIEGVIKNGQSGLGSGQ